jgi:hypothetical protein
MKTFVAVVALVIVIGSVLLASSGGKTSNENRLSVEQLAQLMDFHAWSLPIPQSLQPVKKARLLIVRPDGTEALKWQAGELGSGTSILLGFRVEEGVFKGRLHIRDSKGHDEGWLIKFKEARMAEASALSRPERHLSGRVTALSLAAPLKLVKRATAFSCWSW